MLFTSKGAAGVTGSGFVALVATLTVMPEVPVVGIALLVGIDRFMSEARALTSLCSNAVAVIVVARSSISATAASCTTSCGIGGLNQLRRF